MNIPDSIPDAVSSGTLPRLALVVAIMVLRNPRDVYRVDDIAEWCGVARRTVFVMLAHLKDVHFEIIQVQYGIKISVIDTDSSQNGAKPSGASGSTPSMGTPLPKDYPDYIAMQWAKELYPKADIEAANRRFRSHHLFKGSIRDSWEAAWRSWMKRDHKDFDHEPTGTTTIRDAVSIALSSNPFDSRDL